MLIFCSVVIDSYQVPRAAKAWPDAVILCQLANIASIQPMRIEINFRSIVWSPLSSLKRQNRIL